MPRYHHIACVEKRRIKLIADKIRWSDWASLGRPEGGPEVTELGRPFAQSNQDGRLEVFATARRRTVHHQRADEHSPGNIISEDLTWWNRIFNIAQFSPNGGWRDFWRDKEIPSTSPHGLPVSLRSHVVGTNADGRLEIFAVGALNIEGSPSPVGSGLWRRAQVAPNDGWGEWKTLGKPAQDTFLTDQFTVGKNQDGRQEAFVVGSDGSVWQIWQTAPNGEWSGWRKLGEPPVGIRRSHRITVGSNGDLRQELFVMGGDDALWHIWQVAPNDGWSGWESLGKPRDPFPAPKDRDLSEPLVKKNADGHLEVFAPGNGAFCNRWQLHPNATRSDDWRHEGWNEKPKPPTAGLIWLDAAINVGGPRADRLEVFGLGDDGALWHAWQINKEPFWSDWDSLGSPAVGIRVAEHLTVGTNQDGRLEIFVVGEDGAVWRIGQTR